MYKKVDNTLQWLRNKKSKTVFFYFDFVLDLKLKMHI